MTSFIKRYIEKLTKSLKNINSIIKLRIMDSPFNFTEPESKRQKLESEIKIREFPYQKKKVAMLLVYSGKGYLGMQRNPGFKTIEGDLLDALVKSGVVRPDHIEQPGPKMAFQRAARTDKGVSAAGQVVSLKMFIDVDNAVEKINNFLPPQIRVIGIKKVTKGFDSKKSCDARTYSYLTPTFAFAPLTENVTESYRITEKVLNEVQDILNKFLGTHKFHNFTSGKKPDDPSAKRYIKEFKIGKPFVHDSLEYVPLIVKGQSFMIHHIRKMTGLTMAIMRGYASLNSIDKCWLPEKVDVPKAPSLGLMLEKLHYDFYNKKFGSDGVHESLSWDKYHDVIEKFKNEYIYPTLFNGEKVEKSMLTWLTTLSLHKYDVDTDQGQGRSPMSRAMYLVEGFRKPPRAEIARTSDTPIAIMTANCHGDSVRVATDSCNGDTVSVTTEGFHGNTKRVTKDVCHVDSVSVGDRLSNDANSTDVDSSDVIRNDDDVELNRVIANDGDHKLNGVTGGDGLDDVLRGGDVATLNRVGGVELKDVIGDDKSNGAFVYDKLNDGGNNGGKTGTDSIPSVTDVDVDRKDGGYEIDEGLKSASKIV